MATVTVYYFQKYDIMTDQTLRSKRPATLEAIKRVRGEPLIATALEVDTRELDGAGFRKREA